VYQLQVISPQLPLEVWLDTKKVPLVVLVFIVNNQQVCQLPLPVLLPLMVVKLPVQPTIGMDPAQPPDGSVSVITLLLLVLVLVHPIKSPLAVLHVLILQLALNQQLGLVPPVVP
jgi:hypothetical protein